MRKFFLFLLSMGLLTGCMTENSSFLKKKECAELTDQVMAQIEGKWGEVDGGVTVSGMQLETPQIFYSPKLDTCIYKSEVIQDLGPNSARYNIDIIDFLNNKELFSVRCISKASLVSPEYNNVPQYTSEDLNEFSQCTSGIDDKLKELGVI